METAEMPSPPPNHDARLLAVENRVIHLDEGLTKIGQNQAAAQATLDTVVRTVDAIANRVNQPNQTNWVGMISATVAVIAIMSAGVVMRVSPVEGVAKSNAQLIQQHDELLSERGMMLGSMTTKIGHLEKSLSHLDEQHHETQRYVTELQKRSAASEVSRRAIGDYVQTMDEQGTRASIADRPKN